MSVETGRQRRRNADSDDSSCSSGEDEQQPQQQYTSSALLEPTVTAPAPPTRARAKAPPAAALSTANMTLHVDPTEKISEDEETASDNATPEAVEEAPVVMSEEMRVFSEEIENINYDTLTYAALRDIMQRMSRPIIEEMIALREQQLSLSLQQEQNQRVEGFLDVTGAATTSANHTADAAGSGAENSEGYRYNVMLNCLFEALKINNESNATTERNEVPMPILERMGKKKTVIVNFGRICDTIHRTVEEVKDFIEKELSTHGNLDSKQALILKFESRKPTDFDKLLTKYLDEYVKCNLCQRIDTTLTKNGRRLELRCNVCTATRTVTAVGSATFSAQIEKRSRQRAAMTL